MSRARGAALVLVLWLIALLTAMIGAFALTARVEALQGSMLRNGAQAQEYARAGLEYALFRLQDADTQARWRPDGRRYRWQMDDASVEIRITDESGKVDLNMAEPACWPVWCARSVATSPAPPGLPVPLSIGAIPIH